MQTLKKIFTLWILILFLNLTAFSQTDQNNTVATAFNILNAGGNKNDSLLFKDFAAYLEPLNELYIKAGSNIYFSGEGFVNTLAATAQGKFHLPIDLEKKCRPGTKITFENCRFYNQEGKLIKFLHKSVYLQ